MGRRDDAGPGFARVRGRFWGLLAGVLLLALTAPAVTLWRAGASPLRASACLAPAAPFAGQQAQLTVTVTAPGDRAATQGPWARASVLWDMARMPMGTRALAVPGSPRSPGTFRLVLNPSMAGPWWAQVALSTPGRPVWRTVLRFTVLAAGANGRPASAAQSCARSEGSAGP
jgi:hypothetical protein